MKKKLIGLGILMFVLVLFPATAYAEPYTCPYDPHISIMYNYLTEPQRDLYDRLYDAIRREANTVRVPDGVSRSDAVWLIDFIFNEASELCAFDGGACKVTDNGGSLEIQLAYKLPLSVQNEFFSQVEKLAASFKGLSEEEGIRAIFNYVIRRFDYDTIDEYNGQFAYYALKNNRAVCNGYSQTIAMLCHFAGYPCSYIDGSVYGERGEFVGRHAWNVARANARFFWFDATWSDGSNTEWYGLDGASMAVTHKPDPEYKPIMYLRSILPDHVSYTTHLDVNNDSGFVRGLGEKNGMRVNLYNLKGSEYYSPALVIWNDGSRPVDVTICYELDGIKMGWEKVTVAPRSNLAFRTMTRRFKGLTGSHEIAWYCDGNFLRSFCWSVV